MSEQEEQTTDEDVQFQLLWGKSDDLPTLYANQLFIGHTGGEFYLVFGEASIPALLEAQLDELPESIEINPLVRIALTPENMLRFADAINNNIRRFLSRQVEKGDKE